MKAAAFVAAGAVATGVGYEGAKRIDIVRPASEHAAEVGTPAAVARTSRPMTRLSAVERPEQKQSAAPKAKAANVKEQPVRASQKTPPGLARKASTPVASTGPRAKAKAQKPKAKPTKLHRPTARPTKPARSKPVRPAKKNRVAKPKTAQQPKRDKRGRLP
jgi:hypothetical protein